jgi:hypothetical protein
LTVESRESRVRSRELRAGSWRSAVDSRNQGGALDAPLLLLCPFFLASKILNLQS